MVGLAKVEVCHDAQVENVERGGDLPCPLTGLGCKIGLASQPQAIGPICRDPAKPGLSSHRGSSLIGLTQDTDQPGGLAERNQRMVEIEPRVDGVLGCLAAIIEVCASCQRLLEASNRLSVRRTLYCVGTG